MWKHIAGYEGIYEVNKEGQVRTCAGKVTYTKHHGVRSWAQRTLKQKTDKGGYKRVTLYLNGKPKDHLVHRLVAIAFLPKVDGKELVNHMDGNPSNNELSNLEWCSSKENVNHAFRTGLMGTNKIVALRRKSDGQILEFNSRTKAGLFLGKHHGFITDRIAKGKFDLGEYEIVQ